MTCGCVWEAQAEPCRRGCVWSSEVSTGAAWCIAAETSWEDSCLFIFWRLAHILHFFAHFTHFCTFYTVTVQTHSRHLMSIIIHMIDQSKGKKRRRGADISRRCWSWIGWQREEQPEDIWTGKHQWSREGVAPATPVSNLSLWGYFPCLGNKETEAWRVYTDCPHSSEANSEFLNWSPRVVSVSQSLQSKRLMTTLYIFHPWKEGKNFPA